MKFTSKRGRPAAYGHLTVIEGGKNGEGQKTTHLHKRVNREPIDICHEKGLISDNQHWAALHFRWLYTLRFGAPGISASQLDKLGAQGPKIVDSKWHEEREREYAMAVEKLRKAGALKIVLNLAIFGHFPRCMTMGKIARKDFIRHNLNEVLKLREGLDILASHWGKKP